MVRSRSGAPPGATAGSMDVRCERCNTEYELDDARITEAGVAVRCTSCGHVFKVKKQAPGEAAPLTQAPHQTQLQPEAPSPGDHALPPAFAPSEKPREWKVRQTNGNVFTFRELTTLQKWIVERKVARDDEISLSGENWKRLGNIAELASFFQVVEEAQKAVSLQAALDSRAAEPPPRTPTPVAPETPPIALTPPPTPPPAAPAPAREVGREPAFVRGPAPSAVMNASLPQKPERSAGLRWALLSVTLAASAFAATIALLRPDLLEQGRGRLAELIAGAPSQPPRAEPAPPPPEPPTPAAVTPDSADAGETLVAAPATEPEVDAGTSLAAITQDAGEAEVPDAGAALAVTVDAGAEAEPKRAPPPSFDALLNQGYRWLERERPSQALESFSRASEEKPERAEPHSGIGRSQFDLGNLRAAEASFERALRLNPRYGEALMGLAETYRALGRGAEAVTYYQRYLEVLPNGPEAAVARSNIERLKSP